MSRKGEFHVLRRRTYRIRPFGTLSRTLWSFTLGWSWRQKTLKSYALLVSLLASTTAEATSQTLSESEEQRKYLERIVLSAVAHREPAEALIRPDIRLLETGKCGTPLQIEISRLWEKFSPQQKLQLLRVTSRPTLHTSKLSPNDFFRIHYDTTGLDAPALLDNLGQRVEGTYHAYADSVASAFENSREVEIGFLRYPEPPTDGIAGGGSEYDIYILDLSLLLFGQTIWTGEGRIDTSRVNYTTLSYIEVENDYRGYRTPGLPGLKVTAAHELHHAIQVGNYGVWSDDFYFYELTSGWMEEMVYDEINDYYFDLPRYFRNTGIPLNLWDPDRGYYGYERTIWGLFLTKRHGPSAMRHIWEEMVHVPSLDAMERVLKEVGDSFAQSLVEFFLWNFFTAFRASADLYYDEGANYPVVRILSQIDLSSGTGGISSTAKPLSSQYYQVVSSGDTVTLILVNRDIQRAKNREFLDFEYTYDLSTSNQGSGFLKLPNGVRVRFTAENPSFWQTIYLINNAFATEFQEELALYPNPFILNGFDVLKIPIEDAGSEEVTLYIFTSNLELVYSRTLQPNPFLGRFVLTWNGQNTDGVDVGSGIYFYAIESKKGTSRGKFAVIQQ